MIEYAPFHKRTFTNRLCIKMDYWRFNGSPASYSNQVELYDDEGWVQFIFEASQRPADEPETGRIGAQGKSTV